MAVAGAPLSAGDVGASTAAGSSVAVGFSATVESSAAAWSSSVVASGDCARSRTAASSAEGSVVGADASAAAPSGVSSSVLESAVAESAGGGVSPAGGAVEDGFRVGAERVSAQLGGAGRSVTAVEDRVDVPVEDCADGPAPVPVGPWEPVCVVSSCEDFFLPRPRTMAQATAPTTRTLPPPPANRARMSLGSTGHLRGRGSRRCGEANGQCRPHSDHPGNAGPGRSTRWRSSDLSDGCGRCAGGSPQAVLHRRRDRARAGGVRRRHRGSRGPPRRQQPGRRG